VPEEPVAVPPTTARDRAGERVRERRPSPSAATSRKRLSKKEPAAFRHRAPRRRFSLKPLLIGGLATAVVAVVVAVAGRYRPAPSDRGEAAPGPLAVAADLAESEVLRYRSSARSFDDGRVRCVELGRVLIGLEEAWISYSLERAAATEPLDSAGVEREHRLEEDVVEAERHFTATECPRP